MRKYLLGLLILLTISLGLNAQTLVSGTVTDTDSQTWNNGTYKFSTSALGQLPITGFLSTTGTYTSVSIPHTAATALVGDLWTLTVCPYFSYPCYYQPVTITGQTQTINLTPPGIRISALSNNPAQPTAYSDGEIINAYLGFQYLNVSNLTLPTYHSCSSISGSVCTWSTSSGGGGACTGRNCFLLQSYPGYNGDTQQIVDATWAGGGSNVVTFPNSDGPVAADAGKLCWGMPALVQTGPSSPGTLAVTTPKTAATCTAADLIGSASGNGVFQWGHDDTPAVVAAVAAQGVQPKCGALIWPAALLMVNQGWSYTGTVASDCSFSYLGQGYASHIIMEPGFSFSAVTNNVGCTSLGCFGNTSASTVYQNFSVDATYQSFSGISSAPASSLFTIGPGSYAIGVNFFNGLTALTNTPKAINITGTGPFGIGVAINTWGDQNFWCSGNYCIGNNDGGANVTFKTIGLTYDYAGTYNGLYVTGGGEFHGYGTLTTANNGGFGSASCDRNTNGVYLDSAKIGNGTPGANGIGFQFNNLGSGANCFVRAHNTLFQGGGSGSAISVPSGVTADLYDDGGNTYSSPFLANSGTFRYHHRETGTCTFAASTTCVVNFAFTFGNSTTPTFLIPPNIVGTATTLTISALSTTSATITASASNSASVQWEAVLQ